MISFDEAYQTAVVLLSERGSLLNSHLVKAAGGNKGLSQQVRSALINNGDAEDRYGVGLAQPTEVARETCSTSCPVARTTEINRSPSFRSAARDADSSRGGINSDWWLISNGIIKGPMPRSTLIELGRNGTISFTDAVREGACGPWQRPDVVPGLTDAICHHTTAEALSSQLGFGLSEKSVASGIDWPGRAIQHQHVSDGSIRHPDVEPKSVPIPERPSFVKTKHRHDYLVTEPESLQDQLRPQSAWEATDLFFLRYGGHLTGPITREVLRTRLQRGQISEDDLVQVGFHGACLSVSQVLLEASPLDVAVTPQSPLVDPKTTKTETDHATGPHSPGRAPLSLASVNSEVADSVNCDEHVRPAESLTTPAESPRVVQVKRSESRLSTSSSFNPNTSLWKQAAALVGGEARLWKGFVTAASLLLVVLWWRQPPSAGTIYGEFARCHQKAAELRQKKLNPGEWSATISKERVRVQSLVDGLQERAKASRPAEQQLLWAGKKGLLRTLETPYNSVEADKLFATHMRLAEQILYPQRNKAADDTSLAMESSNQPLGTNEPSQDQANVGDKASPTTTAH